jgi:peroxiredoxin
VKNKTLILIIIISGILIVFFAVRPVHTPKIAMVGSEVQDFELEGSDNSRIKLSDMKGSVVLINFWATWCASCLDELPSIERLHRSFAGDSRFRVVTILFRDNLNMASGFMRRNGYSFPVYLDREASAAKTFGITGVPETFIIDKKGILREKVIGPAEWDSPQALQAFMNLTNEP